jgi:hypothetical protein
MMYAHFLRNPLGLAFGVLCVATLPLAPVLADDAAPTGVRVHNLKVLSDKVDDMTTAENILKSFVKPDMSDADRSKALWTAVVKYRHQTAPPNEYLAADWEAHDPVKTFNSYGYCMCCCCSAMVAALNRMDGRDARGRILNGHSVPEVRYGNDWHMFDASLITYFPKVGKGDVAAVDDISAAVKGWYDKNPGVRGSDQKLGDIMRENGWTGWKAKGPELLSQCPFYDFGFFPAKTHGWNATMVEYDRKCEEYEYGYHVGHKALFSLRPGEALVREVGNRGLHVNMQENKGWDGLKARAAEADLVYTKKFFPGYNGGMVANGYHRYEPDLASGALASGAEAYVNLATGGSPALHLKDGGKPAIAVIPLTSPYVYLGGRIKVKAFRKADADKVRLSLSTNNARTFEPLWSAEKVGASEATIDLKDRILRRYAYWLKVELESASADGAGFDLLSIENDIQHAPRTLPWLGKGRNTITVAVDGDDAEKQARKLGTRSIACRIMPPDAKFPKQETTANLGVTFDNLNVVDGACWWKGGVGTVTVPLETPGPMVVGTFSAQYRARGEKDVIQVSASYDGGKTWEDVAKLVGPTPGKSEYHRFTPKKDATKALLRFAMTGNNTIGLLSFRADVTYVDPHGTTKPPPFFVTHRWKEDGKPMEKRVKVETLPMKYTIDAAGEVEMVSVTYEMK